MNLVLVVGEHLPLDASLPVGVSVPYGCTELTRIPNSPSSTASELVSPTTPNLLTQLWPQPGTALMPAAEVIVTIDPPLPASIIGVAAGGRTASAGAKTI